MIKPYYDRKQFEQTQPGDVKPVLALSNAECSPTLCSFLSSALQVLILLCRLSGAETVLEACESLSAPEIGYDIESPSVATVQGRLKKF